MSVKKNYYILIIIIDTGPISVLEKIFDTVITADNMFNIS